jgi:hypothetical protein
MAKPMPKTHVDEIEKVIIDLLVNAKHKAGKGQVPVCDPDYADAFGTHRGFLIGRYGKYRQSMDIILPDGTRTTANAWFRDLCDRAEAKA